MNELFDLLLAFAAGVLIGVIYFGGLWWTVQAGLTARHPALWFSLSLMLRTGAALAGFYFIGQGHWSRLLICFLGFMGGRVIVGWLCGASKPPVPTMEESRHAPQSR